MYELGSLKVGVDMGQRDYSYDIIRVILVVFVVLGHSDFYQIKTAFGGIYITSSMEMNGVEDVCFHGYIRTLSALIYSFHMPAFMALSGALYRKHYAKYNTFKELITEKTRNLLLPYLIIWICWNIPVKYMAGYYKGIPVWKWLVQMVIPYDVYLWFLLSLNIIFGLCYGLDSQKKVTKKVRAHLVLFAFVFSLLCQRVLGIYMPLGNPLKYLLWFEIGMLLEERKNNHNGVETSVYRNIYLFGAVVVYVIAFYISQHVSHLGWVIRDTICPFAGILALWIVANNVAMRLHEKSKIRLLTISSYSMGLFLYAEPINYLVLSVFEKAFGIELFGSNIGAVLVFLSRIILSVSVALLITNMMKRIKPRVRIY